MKKVLFCVLIFLFSSCQYGINEVFYRDDFVEQRSNKITSVQTPSSIENKDEYSFIIITDVHFGADEDRSCDQKFFTWLQNMKIENRPDFCICLGDIAEHGYSSEIDSYIEFTNKLKNDFAIETYTIIGNHDLYNSGWKYWKENVSPYTSFFEYNTDKYDWYFLDSASCSIGREQYTQLESAMNANSKKKIVFSHYPFYANGQFYFCLQNTIERNSMLTLFEQTNVSHIFVGHTHQRYTSYIGSFTEENIPGFLEYSKWAVIKVNENDENILVTIVG